MAFTLWGSPVSWVELLGDASGALCVWLLARQSIWNWPELDGGHGDLLEGDAGDEA